MASPSLNINAPEFHPNQLYKQQSPTPIISVPHHFYHRFTFYSLRQHSPFVFYPTLSTTLPLSPSQAKPTHMETQHHQQQQHQKQEKIREKTSCSKGFVKQKEVFKVLSCEETVSRGPRLFSNGGGLRFKAFEWRKKEPKEPKKEVDIREKKCFDGPFIKNRQNVLPEQKNFRASSSIFRKRGFPVVHLHQDGDETTVMIKNIPSKYTRDMLVEFLENHCMDVNTRAKENGEELTLAFDFVYLPIDFRTEMNKGYAFVNFTKPKAAWEFLLTSSGRKWELFNSHKIREVVLARIQGKEKLESHFETMIFPYEHEDVLPLSFNPPRDGIIKGDQKTFGRLLKGTNQLY